MKLNCPASTIHNTAPSAAPLDTPTMPGSASGLRNMPCMASPASAMPAPTSTASSRRGKRTSSSTAACIGVKSLAADQPSECARIARTCAAEICTAPSMAEATKATPSAAASPNMLNQATRCRPVSRVRLAPASGRMAVALKTGAPPSAWIRRECPCPTHARLATNAARTQTAPSHP